MDGDHVVTRIESRPRGRSPVARVIKVLDRARETIVGAFHGSRRLDYVVPMDRRLSKDVLVPSDAGGGATDGDVVVDTPPRDKDSLEDIEVVYPRLAGFRRRRLTEVSGVVRGIERDFLRVVKKTRVFVAPHCAELLRARQSETEDLLVEAMGT
jgi:ribonuclease R